MAGFSVANFDFGKNIVDAEIRRQQIAAGERASQRNADLQRRQQDLQLRQQDLNAQQQQAQLAEGARQFDERMGEAAATRAEGARQFDERMGEAAAQRAEGARQFDETTGLKKQQLSWDEALKQQQLDESNMKMQKWSAELDEFLELGRRDREEYDKKMAMQKEMQESELFNVVEGVMLGGEIGGFTPSQVRAHNEKFGTQYDVIGTRDMLTGQPYQDGLIHRVQYQRDNDGNIVFGHMENGQVVEDGIQPKQGSQPLLLRDDVVTKDEYQFGSSRLREYAPRLKNGNNGMSPERIELEKAKLDQRKAEQQSRDARNQASLDLSKYRAAITGAKSLTDLSRVMDEKDFNIIQQAVLDQLKTAAESVSGEPGKEQVKTGDNNPAGEKKVRGYRYNKDRSKRIPVYEDGSQGAVEDIK